MVGIVRDIERFRSERDDARGEAAQRAALALVCGLDIDRIMRATACERRKALARIERLIERERIRGARRHWGYDLNRHIALKQAADRLRAVRGAQ